MTNEAKISQEEVWDEHLSSVNVGAHWGYLFGILGGGLVAMLILIAILGSGSG